MSPVPRLLRPRRRWLPATFLRLLSPLARLTPHGPTTPITEPGLEMERSRDGVNLFEIALVSGNVTTYSDVGLPPATLYYYRVRGTNWGGDSAYSNVSSAMTLPPPPAAPTSLSSIAVSSSQI